MLTQPPIEGNLDCRVRPFHSELCFKHSHIPIAAGACTVIQPAEKIPHGAPVDSERLFLPKNSHGLLSVHDYQTGRNPTFIHFTINGRHGILGARHIAEALQIPYEPSHFDDFRAWTSPTELEMVHILYRGASTRPHLLKGELPPIMFLIDAFLHHNLYPTVALDSKERSPVRSPVLRDFSRPSSSNFGNPSLFRRERYTKRSFRELIPFPSLSKAAMPNSGSTWGILLSLSWSASAFARVVPFIGDPHNISEQPCSRDGSHSSMPRADVGHSGSTHCHLKVAPASFRPATSC
ncbi:hypothetical protein CK203_063521 [Vitis vinifera]|uniref:Uncharacterized protein n=1 Tax=Vitis vinifera TaxID=29760 RepID=A0A438G609_VITVI|nr:hypothetical protein CK203_063521 [Vitis vinifera]